MSVYFIQNEKKRIKIGSAINPEKRLKELQTASDEKLTLIGTKPGGLAEERRIQKQFEFAHVIREWFDPAPELLKFISEVDKEIVTFAAGDQSYPMEIIDRNGEKWVTRKQLADALGVTDLHKLHGRLLNRNEIKEGIHFAKFRVDEGWDQMTDPSKRSSGGPQIHVIYSLKGIIRGSMASEGINAIVFRDWAETVL